MTATVHKFPKTRRELPAPRLVECTEARADLACLQCVMEIRRQLSILKHFHGQSANERRQLCRDLEREQD